MRLTEYLHVRDRVNERSRHEIVVTGTLFARARLIY